MSEGLVDNKAVVAGAGLALAVAVPTIAAVQLIDAVAGISSSSDIVLLFYVFVVAGLVVGGWRAGRLRPDAPLANGSLAALAAYGVIAVVVTVVRIVAGSTVEVGGLVFNGVIAGCAGVIGALLAMRRRLA